MPWYDFLGDLFQRVDIEGPSMADEINPIAAYYAQKVELGSTRIKKYKDYSDMGEDTLISGALDMYADESCQYDRVEGATVWCNATNPAVDMEIRRMLEAIDIESYVFGIARNLAHMGDNFVRPLFNQQEGIVGLEFVDPEDVDRIVDKFNRLVGFRVGGKQTLLDPWTFIHYRIMSRTTSVKKGGGLYGTSFLENTRRTWRMLTLLEDALVIYRLDIGGKHRVFYIDIGNMSMPEALRVTRQFKREFGKKTYYNSDSGEWNTRFNPLNLTSDIFWPVRKDSASRIDYLGGDPNVASIVDIEYFRDRLFSSLRIPKAYIGGDEYSSVKYGLSMIDISFARLIKRLQRAIILGLYRMGQIHLKLRGLEPLDPQNDFEIVMSIISTLDQEQRMEAMDMAINLSAKLRELGSALGIDDEAMSEYIARQVLGLSPFDLQSLGRQRSDNTPRILTNAATGITNPLVESAWNIINKDPEISKIVSKIRKASMSTNESDPWNPRHEGSLPEGITEQTMLEDDEGDNE